MADTTARQERAFDTNTRRIDQRQNNLRRELYDLGRRAGAGKPKDGDDARRAELLAELADPADAEIYDLGMADGEEAAPAKPAGGAAKKAAGGKAGAAKKAAGAAKKKPAGRRRRARPLTRQAAKAATAPARAFAIDGARILGMVAAVLLLSAMLQTADTWTGIARRLGDGFAWLAAPDRSIPYGPAHR